MSRIRQHDAIQTQRPSSRAVHETPEELEIAQAVLTLEEPRLTVVEPAQ